MKLLLVLLVLFSSSLFIAESRSSCLDEVVKFANGICGEIQRSGTSNVVEANGQLKADVSGIVRRVLGNAGGNLNGKAAVGAYENVLRVDLSKELFNIRECRIKMVDVGRSELCKSPNLPTIQRTELLAELQDNNERIASLEAGLASQQVRYHAQEDAIKVQEYRLSQGDGTPEERRQAGEAIDAAREQMRRSREIDAKALEFIGQKKQRNREIQRLLAKR